MVLLCAKVAQLNHSCVSEQGALRSDLTALLSSSPFLLLSSFLYDFLFYYLFTYLSFPGLSFLFYAYTFIVCFPLFFFILLSIFLRVAFCFFFLFLIPFHASVIPPFNYFFFLFFFIYSSLSVSRDTAVLVLKLGYGPDNQMIMPRFPASTTDFSIL
jgi:hypothetical protein